MFVRLLIFILSDSDLLESLDVSCRIRLIVSGFLISSPKMKGVKYGRDRNEAR